MLNYFRLAYALGRTHTSMLAYGCQLHNENKSAPLRTFLRALHLPDPELPPHVHTHFEWRGADLALFTAPEEGPSPCFLLIEMKVDDREGWKKLGKHDVIDTTTGPYVGLKAYAKTDRERQSALYQQRWGGGGGTTGSKTPRPIRPPCYLKRSASRSSEWYRRRRPATSGTFAFRNGRWLSPKQSKSHQGCWTALLQKHNR